MGGVGADVHHGVGLFTFLEPQVERQILVVRRQLDIVVLLFDLTPAACGLWGVQQLAKALGREHKVLHATRVTPDHDLEVFGRPPGLDHGVAQFGR